MGALLDWISILRSMWHMHVGENLHLHFMIYFIMDSEIQFKIRKRRDDTGNLLLYEFPERSCDDVRNI